VRESELADSPDGLGQAGHNRPALSFHVPEPKFRPGDAVDFSDLKITQAGAQARPDETCAPIDTAPLANDLIRVLGEDNRAHGPRDPKLDPAT
jgi:2-oxoisovalerate dehydrogenase E1 component alpha subunit